MTSYHLASKIYQRKVGVLDISPRMNGGHSNFAHPLPRLNWEMATVQMAPQRSSGALIPTSGGNKVGRHHCEWELGR